MGKVSKRGVHSYLYAGQLTLSTNVNANAASAAAAQVNMKTLDTVAQKAAAAAHHAAAVVAAGEYFLFPLII